MKWNRSRMALLMTLAAACLVIVYICALFWKTGKGAECEESEDIDQGRDIFIAETSMEYYQAVAELVKEADSMIVSSTKGSYESARLLIKGDNDLDFSQYEGICRIIADQEGHYTVQFLSSALAEEAAGRLNGLDCVEYAEPDGVMGL